MKTTIDISEALLGQAKRLAERRGTTLRALVEEGLREVLAQRASARFQLRRASFQGRGLRPDVAGWDDIRSRVFEGRGG